MSGVAVARGRTAIALAVVALLGCGEASSERDMDIYEARERLEREVADLEEAVAGDLEPANRWMSRPTECDGQSPGGDGTYFFDYSVDLRVPDEEAGEEVLRAAVERWEAEGREVTEDWDRENPTVRAPGDWGLRVSLTRREPSVQVVGGTPCVDLPEDDDRHPLEIIEEWDTLDGARGADL
jgi:hypothetical protein